MNDDGKSGIKEGMKYKREEGREREGEGTEEEREG